MADRTIFSEDIKECHGPLAWQLFPSAEKREREIKFIGLFENRGHRGPYSPYLQLKRNSLSLECDTIEECFKLNFSHSPPETLRKFPSYYYNFTGPEAN